MPFYDAPLSLTDRALRSVVEQGVEGVEVLIVDDGSPRERAAGLEALAARYRSILSVEVVRQENAGAGAARNRAAEAASNEILAQLDADDRWLEGKLRRQMDLLAAEPETWMVFGAMPAEDPEGRRLKDGGGPRRAEAFAQGPERQYLALLKNNWVNNSTACFRRQGFRELGGYDPALRASEDTDLWVRACRKGLRFRYLDQPLAVQVFHGGNLSLQKEKRRQAWVRLLERELRDPPAFLDRLPHSEVSEALSAAWLKLGRYAAHTGRRRLANEAFRKSLCHRVTGAALLRWLGAMALALPPPAREAPR